MIAVTTKLRSWITLPLFIALLLTPAKLWPQEKPTALRDVGFDQNLNAQLPLDAAFRDESGKTVRLGRYFDDKPVVISFAYYTCPMLCTMILDGMVRGLKQVPAEMGRDYHVVNISIDPRDTREIAHKKKIEYAAKYERAGAREGWHFLTGDDEEIRRVADAAGFRYVYDPVSKQYAHVSGILIATPKGKISRYFYGIVFSPRDLRLGLVEASEERISSPVDRLLLFCYQYNAMTGKYSLLVTRLIQLGGGLTVVLLGFLWFVLNRRVKRRRLIYPADV